MTDGRLPGASRHLAIDQGGHASRVLAFDGAGTCLAHAEASIETRHPSAERVEHDPEALVASVEQSLSAVLDQLSPSRHGINAGLACQRSSSVCWDRLTGRALSPVISWQDRRNADWLDGFIGQQERIQRLTGLRLSPHYGAAKLAWCLDNLPEVREALDRERLCWGPLSAFLTARLTREHTFAVDTSIAGRTLLFEPRRGDWSKELVDLFRLPASVLPPCRPCRSDFGQLAVGGGEIPLGIVIGDQSAALFSHGQPTDGETRVNLGTGGFVQTATYTLPEQTNGLLAGIAWQGMNSPPLYVLEGTINGAGSALDWAATRLGLDGADPARDGEAWLAAVDRAVFLNAVGGLAAPWWRADLESSFVGGASPQEKLGAVLESIAFLVHANTRAMQAAGHPPRTIRLSGGLARLDGLAQRIADLVECPIQRLQLHEATAIGLGRLLAGLPAQWHAGDDRADEFKPRDNPGLIHRHACWQQHMRDALVA